MQALMGAGTLVQDLLNSNAGTYGCISDGNTRMFIALIIAAPTMYLIAKYSD